MWWIEIVMMDVCFCKIPHAKGCGEKKLIHIMFKTNKMVNCDIFLNIYEMLDILIILRRRQVHFKNVILHKCGVLGAFFNLRM